MIDQSRDEFFSTNEAKPCRHCLKRDEPGSGIGPIIADILFESYANAEAERLDRLAQKDAQADGYDTILRQRNNEIYIRACWLANISPDTMLSSDMSQLLSKAA